MRLEEQTRFGTFLPFKRMLWSVLSTHMQTGGPSSPQNTSNNSLHASVGTTWVEIGRRCHKHQVSSRFYKIQELARLKADTPETRKVFLTLVSLSSRV